MDALRFFPLRAFPFGSDGNFSNELLISAVRKEKGEEKVNLMIIDDSVPAGAKLC